MPLRLLLGGACLLAVCLYLWYLGLLWQGWHGLAHLVKHLVWDDDPLLAHKGLQVLQCMECCMLQDLLGWWLLCGLLPVVGKLL